jgi:hypothetical protein
VNIRLLRAWHPEWEWRAERDGCGWVYIGTRAWAEVTVRAYSMLVGPSDDDDETQWRVTEGEDSWTFALWSMRHMAHAERAGKGG